MNVGDCLGENDHLAEKEGSQSKQATFYLSKLAHLAAFLSVQHPQIYLIST